MDDDKAGVGGSVGAQNPDKMSYIAQKKGGGLWHDFIGSKMVNLCLSLCSYVLVSNSDYSFAYDTAAPPCTVRLEEHI